LSTTLSFYTSEIGIDRTWVKTVRVIGLILVTIGLADSSGVNHWDVSSENEREIVDAF